VSAGLHHGGVLLLVLIWHRILKRLQTRAKGRRENALEVQTLTVNKGINMSPVEKAIIAAVAPLVAAEAAPVLKPILDKALVSASPEIQAAEKDLEAFILAVLPDVLAALTADALGK
jgi:hypothetical protein